jgi:hypothetical protein
MSSTDAVIEKIDKIEKGSHVIFNGPEPIRLELEIPVAAQGVVMEVCQDLVSCKVVWQDAQRAGFVNLDMLKSVRKIRNHRDLNTLQLSQNTFIQRQSAQDIVGKGQLFANYAETCPSSIDGRVRGDDDYSREVRHLLKWTRSLFPNGTGIRRCPFSKTGDCNGRHCEPFWKPILKQEQRRTPLCGDDCKYCHDPRHFPNDEWVKLHVHRTPAARRRAKAKTKGGYNPQEPLCQEVETNKLGYNPQEPLCQEIGN